MADIWIADQARDDKPGITMPDHKNEEIIEYPIDGELDLHTFSPKDLKTLIPDYLEECMERGIYEVRIIHGKGIGALRETVHAILKRLPYVESFQLAGHDRGSWGATVVYLCIC